MSTEQNTKLPKRFCTPASIGDIYPDVFTESAIRWMIHKKDENDFNRCIRRIGKKILIDLDEFENWIDEHRG